MNQVSPLYTSVSQNVVSVSHISAVNFIVGSCLLACSINFVISCPLTFQREKTSSTYEMFPNERCRYALAKDVSFNFRHKDVGKSDCYVSPHGSSMCL